MRTGPPQIPWGGPIRTRGCRVSARSGKGHELLPGCDWDDEGGAFLVLGVADADLLREIDDLDARPTRVVAV